MCFGLGFLEQLLIWAVVIGVIFAVVQLVIPSIPGLPAIIVQVLRIVLWAAVLIMVIYFVFDLLGCLTGGTRLGLR